MDHTERTDAGEPEPLHALTTQQRRALEAIFDYWRATAGLPCPGHVIAHRLRVNRSTAMKYVSALHRKRWLRAPSSPAWLTRDPDKE